MKKCACVGDYCEYSSACFGQFFAHLQERKTVIYSKWYNVPRLLSVGGLECGDSD